MTESTPLAPSQIFKAYDIRGLYGEEMDETTTLAIGRAFARVLARLRGKAASASCGSGSAATCAWLTAPAMAAELREADLPGRPCSTPA